MHQLFLSERNLRTLLDKLERYKKGEPTFASIIKHGNNPDDVGEYTSTIDFLVTALPDHIYYAKREPGLMIEDLVPEPLVPPGTGSY